MLLAECPTRSADGNGQDYSDMPRNAVEATGARGTPDSARLEMAPQLCAEPADLHRRFRGQRSQWDNRGVCG